MSKSNGKFRGPGRDAAKEQFWRRVIAGFDRTGRTVRQWCADQGVSEPSFYCFYNRGVAHQALKQSPPALADYERAIDLDPALGAAACAASVLLAEAGRYAEAAATLRSAVTHGADPASAYYHLALVDVGQQDRWAALKDVALALKHDASYGPALALQSQLEQAAEPSR